MSALLKKRGREDVEAPFDSPKRFRGETEQQILQLLEDADEIQKEEDCGASEELVSGVIRSLEEEIGVNQESGLSSDDSVASNMTSGLRSTWCSDSGGIDLDYLLGASDDDLGIPVVNLEDQDASSAKQQQFLTEGVPSLSFDINPKLEGFSDNWYFEDNLVDHGQFAAFEDADAAAMDLVSHGTLFDGDYSAAWKVETASCAL